MESASRNILGANVESSPANKDVAEETKKNKRQNVADKGARTLLTKQQYAAWRTHRQLVLNVSPRVDVAAPRLIPEMYMKSRILEQQVAQADRLQLKNLKLVCKVNVINRTAGFTDCWLMPRNNKTREKLRRARMVQAEILAQKNKQFYYRLANTKAIACIVENLNVEWKHTLDKIKLMGKFPFCLESSKPIDRGMTDPKFVDISGRKKYWMEFNADGGIRLGKIVVELFEKNCPKTCQVFKKLVKGTPAGEAYSGTNVFMIVPEMFCSTGDAIKNNGFGGVTLDEEFATPENFDLNHSIPGVLSMNILDEQINGIFNIIFKPMPFLDGKAVVFGRIVAGSSGILESLSCMGTPLGMTRGNPMLSTCGWFDRRHRQCRGMTNMAFTD